MASLEMYDKLKKEIMGLIRDNLLDNDAFFLNLISNSKDSKGVMGLVKDMKEEGNTCFKRGEIDDALEKYGYAVMILARYHFVEEEDRVEFFKLAICILMNSAVCFSKNKEFVQVGRICSIVLEFDPNNVKAMFRRAMAAIELGKKDWAKLDLLMAAEIDPNNKEVIKKLKEMKTTSDKETSKNHSHVDIPTGLGRGLPSPKNKVKKNLEIDNSMKQEKPQGIIHNTIEDCTAAITGKKVDQQEDLRNMEDMETQNQSRDNMINSLKEKKEVKDALVSVEEKKEVKEMARGIGDVSSKRVPNLAEPKYRFDNRRRPGSSISISRKDYHELMKGKSICCVNSRVGSPMIIRLVKDVDELKKKDPCEEVKMVDSTGVAESSFPAVNSTKMELKVQSKGDSAMADIVNHKEDKKGSEARKEEDNWHIDEFGCNSDSFSFNSASSIKRDHNSKTRARKRIHQSRYKVTSTRKRQNSSAITTHSSILYRYHVGMKRKPVRTLLESDQRPRKQYLVESSCSIKSSCNNVVESSFISVEPCSTNNNKEMQDIMQGAWAETHMSASKTRND